MIVILLIQSSGSGLHSVHRPLMWVAQPTVVSMVDQAPIHRVLPTCTYHRVTQSVLVTPVLQLPHLLALEEKFAVAAILDTI